ncbi:hypothetical protein BaRGS_00025671 [Batillaria attramentaria]|uniref:Uncharacterized protein n=1 Tax=Batillaria attramentaria TaxID=370345 RepID=A0ABD0K7S8_9CAEN
MVWYQEKCVLSGGCSTQQIRDNMPIPADGKELRLYGMRKMLRPSGGKQYFVVPVDYHVAMSLVYADGCGTELAGDVKMPAPLV